MKQNKMLAMILAGGRGTRLLDLTKKNASLQCISAGNIESSISR